MQIDEKQVELAVLATKDIVATLLREPKSHRVQGEEGAIKLFDAVLKGIATAIVNLRTVPKS